MQGYPYNTASRADGLAVVCETESLTYRELDERASALAHVLIDLGAIVGERIGIMLPNSIEFVECLAASAKVQVPSLTINWHLRAEELAWIVSDSDIGVLIAHTDHADVVGAATAGSGCRVLWVGGDYEERLAAAPNEPVPYAWPTSWPVIYTSGTSGRPKGVIHGAAAPDMMEMTYEHLMSLWGYGPDDVHLVAGPLYHAGPLGYCNLTLFTGGTVVILDSWDANEFLRNLETHRVTTTFLTPAHFIRILELPERQRRRYDVSSLRQVIHAGAPCPRSVKERMIAAFPHADIWELYGMSEGGATRVSGDEWLEHPGTVGLPWPGIEIRILDADTGAPVPAGHDGLIYVRPAHGRFRYHNDEAKTAEAWNDDAFTVGDIGHLDEAGYLYLTDRRSDMVIRSGVNIYPREVEEVLHRHDAVVDCAVFGVPDDRDGELLKAVVETRAPIDPDDLADWCRQQLDPYKCPSIIDLTDRLPRDPNGKVLKRLLRDEAWAAVGRAI